MKYNILIVEFIGVKPKQFGTSKEYELYGVIESIEDGEDEKHFFTPEEMKFHSDWNWLMPAAKFCLNYDDSQDSYWSNICEALGTCDIDSVYNAVGEFIESRKKPFIAC